MIETFASLLHTRGTYSMCHASLSRHTVYSKVWNDRSISHRIFARYSMIVFVLSESFRHTFCAQKSDISKRLFWNFHIWKLHAWNHFCFMAFTHSTEQVRVHRGRFRSTLAYVSTTAIRNLTAVNSCECSRRRKFLHIYPAPYLLHVEWYQSIGSLARAQYLHSNCDRRRSSVNQCYFFGFSGTGHWSPGWPAGRPQWPHRPILLRWMTSRPNIHPATFFLGIPTSTSTRRPSFSVVPITRRVGISSASLSNTSGFLFLVIVEGLAAMNEVMLDGLNDVIGNMTARCRFKAENSATMTARRAAHAA